MRFRYLQSVLDTHVVSEDARAGIEAILARIDPVFFSFMLEVGSHAGLARAEALLRAQCATLQFGAIQLADDQADGELTYLQPQRAPTLQALLLTLANRCVLRSQVPPAVLGELADDFLCVGTTHLWELGASSSAWTIEHARRAAEGLNGRQYRAYFRLMTHGTPRGEMDAAREGELFGRVLHVAGDFASADARWLRLDHADRRALALWAREQAEELLRFAEAPTRLQLGRLLGLLEGALAACGPEPR